MPKLHVIYDPTDKLQSHHPDLPKAIKVAVIPIAEDVDPKDFAKLAAHIAELLLEQFANGHE